MTNRRFARALATLEDVGDKNAREETEDIIRFAEVSEALSNRVAVHPPSSTYPRQDVLRSLLEGAEASVIPDRPVVLQSVLNAIRSIDSASAVDRTCVLPSLAHAVWHVDPEVTLALIGDTVKMLNQAAAARNGSNSELLIYCDNDGISAAVRTTDGLVNFPLDTAVWPAHSLESLVREANTVKLPTLEAALLELEDETMQCKVLLALAESRLPADH